MFVLAERIGCTVAELRNRISYRELLEWRAYDELKALTPEQMQVARLAAMTPAERGRALSEKLRAVSW